MKKDMYNKCKWFDIKDNFCFRDLDSAKVWDCNESQWRGSDSPENCEYYEKNYSLKTWGE